MANFCVTCGVALTPEGVCPKCGKAYASETQKTNTGGTYQTVTKKQETSKYEDPDAGFFEKATMSLTELTGEKDFVDLRFRDLFAKVFKRHTLDEAESIFITGTKNTTPKLSSLTERWPKPWLFSRIFMMFLITFIFLYVCFIFFGNTNAVPGLIFIGAVAVPLSLLVFCMELNAPRNISFYEVLKVFFIGGGASLVVTVILFTFVSLSNGLDYTGAMIVGVVEELAKFVVVAYFIKKNKEAEFVLNGILIGAAVGAGFAAFETAGYILNFGLEYGISAMMAVLGWRALLAPGGHVAWAAITGGALMLVKKNAPFKISMVANKKFLGFAFLAVALHAVWDMPIPMPAELAIIPVVQIGLTIAAWAILLVLMSAGLKDVSRRAKAQRIKEAQENLETVTV